MFTYMEAEKCHFVSFTLEVCNVSHTTIEVRNGSRVRIEVDNGNRAKMEARNGIFFAGPSSFSVGKREGDTRAYI